MTDHDLPPEALADTMPPATDRSPSLAHAADQSPPHDLDVERAVLSAILLSPEQRTQALGAGLAQHDFYSPAHQLILLAVRELTAEGLPIDTFMVAHRLRAKGHDTEVGLPYLGELVDATPAIANAPAHVAIVKRLGLQRRLIHLLHGHTTEAYRGELGEVLSALHDDVSRVRTEHAATADGWTLLGPDDIMAPIGPVPWLCEPLELAPGPPSMIMGSGYSRKTWAAQQIAFAIDTGTRVLGRWLPDRTGPVLHLDYEQGERLTRERYQRLVRAAGVRLRDLTVAPFPPVYLDSPDFELQLCRQLDGFVLCVIDCLSAGLVETDENLSDIRRVMTRLARASERTGCAILLIHHARKEGNDPQGKKRQQDKHSARGSGAIYQACQAVIGLDGDDADTPSDCLLLKRRITGGSKSHRHVMAEDIHDPDCPDNDCDERRDDKGHRPACLRWGIRVWADDVEEAAAAATVERQQANEARAGALEAAGVMALVLASSPGLSRNELYGGVRAHLGKCSDPRCATAREVLRPALVIVDGARNASHHYLDGSQLPRSVLESLNPTQRVQVSSCRPPQPTNPDTF